jgi:hypothetical protein
MSILQHNENIIGTLIAKWLAFTLDYIHAKALVCSFLKLLCDSALCNLQDQITPKAQTNLFLQHDGTDIGTLIAKWFALGYGGLWMGLRHTKVNKDFLNEVKKVAPKEQRLLVSCGDGLR